MRKPLFHLILAAATLAAAPAPAASPEVEDLMKARDRIAAARCQQWRLHEEALAAAARKDEAASRRLHEEARRIDDDPELAAAAKRNADLTHGRFYTGEDAKALREQSLRHKECYKKQ